MKRLLAAPTVSLLLRTRVLPFCCCRSGTCLMWRTSGASPAGLSSGAPSPLAATCGWGPQPVDLSHAARSQASSAPRSLYAASPPGRQPQWPCTLQESLCRRLRWRAESRPLGRCLGPRAFRCPSASFRGRTVSWRLVQRGLHQENAALPAAPASSPSSSPSVRALLVPPAGR